METEPEVDDRPIETLVAAAQIKLILKEPVFGHLLTGVSRRCSDDVSTLGVSFDGHPRLTINPSYFTGLRKLERVGALMHEALHLLFAHVRRPVKTASERAAWNIATDIFVNQLVKAPWVLPEGALLIDAFPDMQAHAPSAVEYFEALKTCELSAVATAWGDHSGWTEENESFRRVTQVVAHIRARRPNLRLRSETVTMAFFGLAEAVGEPEISPLISSSEILGAPRFEVVGAKITNLVDARGGEVRTDRFYAMNAALWTHITAPDFEMTERAGRNLVEYLLHELLPNDLRLSLHRDLICFGTDEVKTMLHDDRLAVRLLLEM